MSDLLPVDRVRGLLSDTEPVEAVPLESPEGVKFAVGGLWPICLKDAAEGDLAPVKMRHEGQEFQLTVRAALQAGGLYGLPEPYVRKSNAKLYQGLLNYHYQHAQTNMVKALVVGNVVKAFVRPSLSVYSNLSLLQSALDVIGHDWGDNTEVLVDGRTYTTMPLTQLRLVVPSISYDVSDGWMLDVPPGESDTWYAGIQITNSVTGKSSTDVQAYLFREKSRSAIAIPHNYVKPWSRSRESLRSVEDWTREAVSTVLDDYDHAFDSLQQLTTIDLDQRIPQVLQEAIKPAKVKREVAESIGRRVFDYDEVSLYTLMCSMSIEADNLELSQEHSDRLIKYAGQIARKQSDFVSLKGEATTTQNDNPYTIGGR